MLTGKPTVDLDTDPVTMADHNADAIVYSNIEAPEMELFANVYGETAPIVASNDADEDRDFYGRGYPACPRVLRKSH